MQISRVFYHPAVILLAGAITVIFCISLYLNTREIRSSTQAIAQLERDVEKTSKDVANAQNKYEASQTEFAKEKITREQLLMQKPGEYVVQIPDLPAPSYAPTAGTSTLTPWQEWQKLLF